VFDNEGRGVLVNPAMKEILSPGQAKHRDESETECS